MSKYILNKGTKVIVIPEGSTCDLSSDHPFIGSTKYGDLWSRDCVVLETAKELDPRLQYNAELEVVSKLTEDSPEYVIDALKEQEYQRRTDPLTSQLTRLSAAGEVDKAAEVEKKLTIENARIQEEFGQGSIVLITESGNCYHTDPDCPALVGHEVREVPLSVGLAEYEACGVCEE